MKKRNLNSRQLRLMSVGLLASSAVLSVADSAPIVAKEKETQDTQGQDKQESVTILSSTAEETEISQETMTSETIGTSTSSEESTSTTESSTEETTDSSTTDSTSSTESSTIESDSTTESSTTSTSETSTSSSSSSTTSSSSTSTSTSTSKPQPAKPKPKPKPTKPSQSNKPTWVGSVQGPVQPATPNYPVNGNTAQTIGNSSNETISVSPNLTTKAFINVIGEDAREIAGTNNLYASVMIAQAILESASGNSTLAAAPNYNLFGIKGSYKGASANFLTSEDNGSGSMYTIRSDFRKYPSYKESLEDYVKLLRGGTDFNNDFYSGTWKSNTKSHKDATSFLTGKYATDTSYAGKLNGLIEAYDLTQYDELKDKSSDKKAEDKTVSSLDKKVTKKDKKQAENIEFVTHVVKKGESLKSISELYNISTLAILEKNQLDRRMLFIGQTLKIPKQEIATDEISKEEVVDRSFEMAQKLSMAFSGRNNKKVASNRAKDSRALESSTTASSVSMDSSSLSSSTDMSSDMMTDSSTMDSSESSTSTMDSSDSSESSASTMDSSALSTSTMDSSESSTSTTNSTESSTTSSTSRATSKSSSSRKNKSSRKNTNDSEKETADSSSDYKVSATRTKTKNTYEVKEGDTLASISKKTGVSILSLKEWNELDQYFLTEGQLLVLSPLYKLDA